MSKKIDIILLIMYIILIITDILTVYAGIINNAPPYRIILRTVAACLWAICAGMRLTSIIVKEADD